MQEFHQAQQQLQQSREEYRAQQAPPQQQVPPQQQGYQQAPMGAGQQPPQFDPAILAQAQGGFKVDGQ